MNKIIKTITIFLIFLLFAFNAYAANNIVRLGPTYIPNPSAGRALGLAYIYVGIPDTDPTVTANQKTLYVQEEDGTITSVTQPIRTNAGGVPVYDGDPVTLLTDGDYSLTILNSSSTQVYYISSSAEQELSPGNYYYPYSGATDQGVTGNSDTIKYGVDSIGVFKGTHFFRHDSGADQTTYTLTTSETIPIDQVLEFEPGAIIDGAGTLAFSGSPNEQIKALPGQQIFGPSITVTFAKAGKDYEAWWYSGTGVYNTAVQAAIDALPTATPGSGGDMTSITGGGIVEMVPGYVEHSGVFTIPSGVRVIANSQTGTSINYSGSGVAVRFYVSGDKVWYSSLENVSITDTGTGTVGVGIYNGQHCTVDHLRIDGFTTGILFDGDDGAGTEGCYNNRVLFCDINNSTTGVDMGTDAFINQNMIYGGRIRLCSSYWVKLGDDGNDYYVSSNVITGVNFVDITGDGGFGIALKGRKNMIFGNRMEQSSNHAGTQTFIKIYTISYDNQIGPNALANANVDTILTDDNSFQNTILENRYGYEFGCYSGTDIFTKFDTGLALSVLPLGDVTAHQTFTVRDTIIFMNPSDAGYNLNPSGTFPVGFVVIVKNTNGAANDITFDSTGASLTVSPGESRIFYYNGADWGLFDFT